MKNSSIHFIKKLLLTLKDLKMTAYHHYGNNIYSIPKFIYFSLFKINTFIIVGIDLDNKLPKLDIEPEFKIIKPTIDELDRLRSGKDLPREFYYDKIHGIKKCYIVLCQNELAYIHWVYLKGDKNRFLVLSDDVAELNYNTTLPKFRGRKLMAKMVAYIVRDLKKEGYKKVVGLTHSQNIASIKSVKRAGFKELGKVKAFGPFNMKVRV